MLEIKNLTKIYKTKGGADVRALDNVSINFEETGLVFLLGKSGSGKSTLLNLAGGLDEPTSGEVIVMGKSSKDFTGGDFDSYRNTFIGFVFQEYNVLNEFNVEENISLALELQGKTKNKDKVKAILEEVELANFAKRKPNTLSGGQKQRIAIARALVKDPQIIMADEPTGALDSATGKQVFDTLKKLSETRLVIVVSHDREFAEVYGDRIVELKDGKIISDVIKVRDKAEPVTESVSRIGENTLAIKKGAKIDDAAMREIREFLSSDDSDVIISKGAKEVASFKRVNRIDDEGAQERFDVTDESKLDIKEYDGSAKFIRSRLPASKAIRIGAAGLKLKPLRLVFTILLSFISFVMFGLFSTMMLYDKQTVLINSFRDSDYDYVMVSKQYHYRTINYYGDEVYEYDQYSNAQLTPDEVTKYGADAVGMYSFGESISNLRSDSKYYQPTLSYAAVLPEGHPMRAKKIAGEFPKDETEIMISSYIADCIINGLFYPLGKDDEMSSKPVEIENRDKVLYEKLMLRDKVLTISGIFDSGDIPFKYEDLKDAANLNGNLEWEFIAYINEGMQSLAFVNQDFIDLGEFTGGGYNNINRFDYGPQLYIKCSDDVNDYRTGNVKVYEEGDIANYDIVRLIGSGALKDDELILNRDFVARLYVDGKRKGLDDRNQELQDSIGSLYALREQKESERNNDNWDLDQKTNEKTTLEENIQNNPDDPARPGWQTQLEILEGEIADLTERIETLDSEISDLDNQIAPLEAESGELKKQDIELTNFYNIVNGYEIYVQPAEGEGEGEWREPTAEERANAKKILDDFIKASVSVEVFCDRTFTGFGTPLGTYKVVGYYYSEDGDTYIETGYYCSQSFYDGLGIEQRQETETNYVKEPDACFAAVLAPLDKNEDALVAFFGGINILDERTDVRYVLNNSLFQSVEMVNDMMDMFSLVFLILGIVLAVFSALLLFNFISMSISNKKKEIGILRAVGARGTDVFKIFFAESGIIVGICLVLALIGTIVGASLLNNIIREQAGLGVTLFNFGPISIAIMVGVALVVALVATFLPVYFAARKKPVESIRAL